MKKGVLLLNLGTPDSTNVRDVRLYLREFLSDPRVLDISAILRFLLLNLVILPTRPKQSAAAYSEIWTAQGSPLLVNTKELTKKVKNELGDEIITKFAMRYGKPSIEAVIAEFHAHKIDSLYVLPLFPQYASSSYGSALAEIYAQLQKFDYVMPVQVKSPYYADQEYIQLLTDSIKVNIQEHDYILMSFHGLPERHVIRSDGGTLPKGCDLKSACPKISRDNSTCYRAQCYATARELASNFGIKEYGVAFQSRLGKTPWIQPYTDQYLNQIYASGNRKLVVICPSFTADCLETLEEIGIGLRKQWLDMGGESFQLIPCLNSHNNWAKLIAKWVKQSQT